MKRSILHIGNTGARIRIFIFLFSLSYMYMYGNDDIENIDGFDNSLLLSKINQYRETYINDVYDTVKYYSNVNYDINIKRRNALIHTMPYIPITIIKNRQHHGKCKYIMSVDDEGKYNLNICGNQKDEYTKMLGIFIRYLKPDIYNETIIEDYLLSPLYLSNKKHYIYHNVRRDSISVKVQFIPKVKNTQLVTGYAIVDYKSGRVLCYEFEGEYDMNKFHVRVMMSDGSNSSVPESTYADLSVKYLGNHILFKLKSSNSIVSKNNEALDMNCQLDDNLQHENDVDIIHKADSDTISEARSKRFVFFDFVNNNLVNKINTSIGADNQGTLRLGPILNPLYFGYSNKKGLVYKLRANVKYNLSDNSNISARIRFGYSFRQKQPYFNIPVYYYFDKKNNGFINLDFGNGNRITNSTLLEKVKQENEIDSIDFNKMNLDYFKDLSVKLVANYDFTPVIGLQGGFIFHRRSAVDPLSFEMLDKQAVYKSFAPLVQLKLSPWGDKGIIFTADYEHGLNGILGSTVNYNRWEFDASYIHDLTCARYISVKSGFGFYSSKGKDQYFLDYSNFRDNNLTGGWRDEWTGDFELLDRNWYNASDYYVRLNSTYESPLLIFSRVPIFGQIIETERLYMGIMTVRKINPYVEMGYAFTNRVFSLGVFTGLKNMKFEGVGFRFGFELFDKW